MSDEFELSMSVPLDSERFLRRACPTCEREFKWHVAEEGEEASIATPEGGYFCPYCAVQAPPDSWWTEAQLEAAKAEAMREVIGPQLDQLADSAEKASSGFLDVSVERSGSETPPALSESDDMSRVDFDCHPSEPVKVDEDWDRAVHCLICGKAAGG